MSTSCSPASNPGGVSNTPTARRPPHPQLASVFPEPVRASPYRGAPFVAAHFTASCFCTKQGKTFHSSANGYPSARVSSLPARLTLPSVCLSGREASSPQRNCARLRQHRVLTVKLPEPRSKRTQGTMGAKAGPWQRYVPKTSLGHRVIA